MIICSFAFIANGCTFMILVETRTKILLRDHCCFFMIFFDTISLRLWDDYCSLKFFQIYLPNQNLDCPAATFVQSWHQVNVAALESVTQFCNVDRLYVGI